MFQEQLDGRICDDGAAVGRAQEVLDVLGDRGNAEIVFACAFHETEQERRTVVVFHHDPRLINEKEALREFRADEVPDIVQDHKHPNGAQFLFKIPDREDDQAIADVDVGWLIKKPGETTFGVFIKFFRHILRTLEVAQDGLKVAQNRWFLACELGSRDDFPGRIGFRDCPVEERIFFGRHFPKHEFQQACESHDVRPKDVRRVFAFRDERDVEWVDVFMRRERNIEHAPRERFRKPSILIFRINHNNHLNARHERTDDLKFRRV